MTRAWVPWGMIAARALLGPGIVLAARAGVAGPWLGAMVVAALVDDVYDGVLARRWGCDTARLRVCDSLADTVFYLGAAVALWLRRPEVIRGNAWGLGVLFGLEGVRYGFDLWKFRRTASYHSYLAKTWGLLLGVGLAGVLSFGQMAWLVRVAVVLGVVVNVEGLLMSVLLLEWEHDVRHLRAAWRLRRMHQRSRRELMGSAS